MGISEAMHPVYADVATDEREMTIDRRLEGSELNRARAMEIVDEFETLTQDRDAVRTITRLIRRGFARFFGEKLRIMPAELRVAIRENTPETIRNLIIDAYNKLDKTDQTAQEAPKVSQMARSKTLLRLGETLRDLGHPVKPIANQTQCRPGQLYKIYPPKHTIRRSVTGMCRGQTAGGAPFFEFDIGALGKKFELGERRTIQRITTNTGRVIRNDNIIFGGHFVGYTHLGRPVFRILEPTGEGTDLQEKFVTVDDDRYSFID